MKKVALSIAAIAFAFTLAGCGAETGSNDTGKGAVSAAENKAPYTAAEKTAQEESGFQMVENGLSEDMNRVIYEIDTVLESNEQYKEDSTMLFIFGLLGAVIMDVDEEELNTAETLPFKDHLDAIEKIAADYPEVKAVLDKRGFDAERLSEEALDLVVLNEFLDAIGEEAADCIENSNTFGAGTGSACDGDRTPDETWNESGYSE